MKTQQLERAIEKVRQLPKERQEVAATALEIIALEDDALTSSEINGVKQARVSVRAGRYANDKAVAAFFRRLSV